MRTSALAAVALCAACFSPDSGSTSFSHVPEGESSGDVGVLDESSSDVLDESGTSAGEMPPDGDGESTGGDEDGGAIAPGCGNDVVDIGELCFFNPVAIDLPASGGDVAIADFDADGHLDVAISDLGTAQPGAPRILLGDGTGGFAAPLLAPAPSQPVGPIAVGAIADGTVDLVGSSWSGAFRWRGGGDGSFGAPETVGTSLADLDLADLDGDGRLDLVAADTSGEGLVVRLADVDEGYPTPMVLFDLGASVSDRVIVSAELDGDGIVDLVSGGGSGLGVFRGTGGGAFGQPVLLEPFEPVGALAVGDFDGDGLVDIAAGYSELVRVRLAGGGTPIDISAPGWITGLAAPDLDHDGLADLVLLDYDGAVGIARNEGGGAFPVLHLVALPDAGSQVGLAIGDLDEDGVLDIVTVAGEGGAAYVMLSNP